MSTDNNARQALERIAAMDPEGKRADDLGRAARIARAALSAPAQDAQAADQLKLEQALAQLIDLLCPGLDSGNILRDAEEAARVAARTQPATPAQDAPSGKLDDSEQYRMQMAAISSAALGYWTEADGIHPDYDTVPLRDVAKLYAKYDALHRAATPPAAPHPVARQRQAWPHDASDRVHDLIGKLAAKELECQRLREAAHSVATPPAAPQAAPQAVAWQGQSVERLRKAQRLAKMAADNIAAHSKAGKGMTGWLDDACTWADSATNEIDAVLRAAPSDTQAAQPAGMVPLTPQQIKRGWREVSVHPEVNERFVAGVRFAERHHGITPAATKEHG